MAAEKVARFGLSRDPNHMLYVENGLVFRVGRKQPGMPKPRPEQVTTEALPIDDRYVYFVDRDGDVSRSARAVRRPNVERKKMSAAKPRKAATKAKTASAKKPRTKPSKRKSASRKPRR